jgi:hypothetical protein
MSRGGFKIGVVAGELLHAAKITSARTALIAADATSARAHFATDIAL